MGVHHEKISDGVRVHQKKERWGESSPRKKSGGVRVPHKRERWGESLPREKARWGER